MRDAWCKALVRVWSCEAARLPLGPKANGVAVAASRRISRSDNQDQEQDTR